MKLIRKVFFSSFLTLVLLFGACGNKVYDRFCHTPLEGWEKNDTLSFAVPKIANTGLYGIDLSLITSASYPFQGLTLIVEQHILPSKRTEIDTLSCVLFDQNGRSKGRGISRYQYEFHVNDHHLSSGDSLFVTVRHDMKREILPGISDIGIQIRKR